MLRKNTLKEKLKQGKVCISIMSTFTDAGMVESIGLCKIDAVCFDSEHGSIDINQLENLSRACELAGVTPICRIPAARPEIVLRTLDAGVMGIVCPHVRTREDAEALVTYIKYPPLGIRGMAMTARAPGYTAGSGPKDYTTMANEETLAFIQIEDKEGVDNFESIVKTPGIDGIFIGRNDLSMSMGALGNVNEPSVQEAIEKVARLTFEAKLPLMLATDEVEGLPWIRKGAKILSIHIVPFLRRKLNEAALIVSEESAKLQK